MRERRGGASLVSSACWDIFTSGVGLHVRLDRFMVSSSPLLPEARDHHTPPGPIQCAPRAPFGSQTTSTDHPKTTLSLLSLPWEFQCDGSSLFIAHFFWPSKFESNLLQVYFLSLAFQQGTIFTRASSKQPTPWVTSASFPSTARAVSTAGAALKPWPIGKQPFAAFPSTARVVSTTG